MLFCQIVATVVASRHPKVATVERTVRRARAARSTSTILQNILGKTLATAYSARASSFAGVSTPLDWEELDEAIDPRDFTITTAPARFARSAICGRGCARRSRRTSRRCSRSTRATDCSSRRAAQRESDRNPLGGTRQELSRAVSTSRITAALAHSEILGLVVVAFVEIVGILEVVVFIARDASDVFDTGAARRVLFSIALAVR